MDNKNNQPAQQEQKMRKTKSKALGEFTRIGRELNIIRTIQDPATGKSKLYIPKKGTADYNRIMAEFNKSKRRGY